MSGANRVVSTAFVCLLGLVGCDRDPLGVDCPDASEGELLVTEIRGPQSGEDVDGEWIEIHNASGRDVDLRGLGLVVTRLDGASQATILVRDSTPLLAGGYAVLGRHPSGAEPGHVDYGYAGEYDSKLYDSAAVELSACGESLDLVVYRNLPSRGTYSLDGSLTPSAEGNDDERNWCVDDVADDTFGGLTMRGTPRERNRTCSP